MWILSCVKKKEFLFPLSLNPVSSGSIRNGHGPEKPAKKGKNEIPEYHMSVSGLSTNMYSYMCSGRHFSAEC